MRSYKYVDEILTKTSWPRTLSMVGDFMCYIRRHKNTRYDFWETSPCFAVCSYLHQYNVYISKISITSADIFGKRFS